MPEGPQLLHRVYVAQSLADDTVLRPGNAVESNLRHRHSVRILDTQHYKGNKAHPVFRNPQFTEVRWMNLWPLALGSRSTAYWQ